MKKNDLAGRLFTTRRHYHFNQHIVDILFELLAASACVVAFFFISFSALASEVAEQGEHEQVRLTDIQQGSLLFKTNKAGVYIPAPILKTDVDMRISGMIVRTKLVQRFSNTSTEWLEGIYVFPLPENAAVDHMRMRIGERIIEGKIKERAEAKKIYATAKRAGKKTALIEQQRPNLFTSSVANIGPGEEVSIEIEYQQTLQYDQGEFRVRFPMTVTPRYIPGKPTVKNETITSFQGGGWSMNTDQVPDASRITPPVYPGEGSINPVTLRIKLDAGMPLAQVRSAYHEINTVPHGEGRYTVSLVNKNVPADRDFELIWVPDTGYAPKAALFSEQNENDAYHLIMVMPPTESMTHNQQLAREVIYIIDTSGSMGGQPIVQAKQALLMALDRLRAKDSFNVIQFNSVTDLLFPHARPASPRNLTEARRYVSHLQANGGTEMAPALEAALGNQTEQTRIRQVIFLTDGSVGNESHLFALIKQRLGKSRLFTIGIGPAPNSHFMSKAARFGRGTFTYIGKVSEVQEKMTALFTKLEQPVMSNLHITWPEGVIAEVWPQRLPDLYAGEPVIFTARTSGNTGNLKITGQRDQEKWHVELPLQGGQTGSGVGVLWARSKIAALMDRLHEGADKQAIKSAVVKLALGHHIVSKYTSLVAVDVTPSRPEGATLSSRAMPHNLPKGTQFKKFFGPLPQTATPAQLHLYIGVALLLLAIIIFPRKPRHNKEQFKGLLG